MIEAHVLAVKPHPDQAKNNPGCWAVQFRVSHGDVSRTFWRWYTVREMDKNHCYVTPSNQEPSHDEILAQFWGDLFAELHGFNFHDD